MPRNASVRVTFDRLLAPSTTIRQAMQVFTGSIAAPFVSPRYDILTSSLTLEFSGDLLPKTLYDVVFWDGVQDGVLLRAFDGAPLAQDDLELRWSFVTSAERDPALDGPPFPVVGCQEVADRFTATCASRACHGGEAPAMGLSFASREDFQRTAIGRVARQTDIGDQVGIPLRDPSRFGIAMPLIEPYAAHNSYLVYKLLLARENLAPCAREDCAVPSTRACTGVSEQERERIREWFVLGEQMPPARPGSPDSELPSAAWLDCGFMQALTQWINAGAKCP